MSNETLIHKIKKTRRILHAILDNNHVLEDTNEVANFDLNIELCRMWLGKLLGYIGDQNPYAPKDGVRKTVADIEEPGDISTKADVPACILVADSIEYTELIDRLRIECDKIEKVITESEFPQQIFFNDTQAFYAHLTIQQSWKYINEAKMWLGAELGSIRDEQQTI